MAIQKILGTDKLRSGFRVKYNETVDEIISDNGSVDSNGVLSFPTFGGGSRTANLADRFYTIAQINQILSGVLFGATTTTAGLVELATEAEALALEDGNRVITPATLGSVLNDLFTSNKFFTVFEGEVIEDFNVAVFTGLFNVTELTDLTNRPTVPTTDNGLLWVYAIEDKALQEYLDFGTGIFYERRFSGSTWTPWQPKKDSTVPDYIRNITTGDIDEWNNAFAWGDHSIEGYLKETELDDELTLGLVQLRARYLNLIPGIIAMSANGYTGRSIVGEIGEITVQNGDGYAANPHIGLAKLYAGDPFWSTKSLIDNTGRVINTANLTPSDVVGLVDSDGNIMPNIFSRNYVYPIKVSYEDVVNKPISTTKGPLLFLPLPQLVAMVNQPITPYNINIADYLLSGHDPLSINIKFVILNPKSEGLEYTANGTQITITGTPTQETSQSVIAAYVEDFTGINATLPIPTIISPLAACDRPPTILSVDLITNTSIRVSYDALNVFVIDWEITNTSGTILRSGQLDYNNPATPFPPTLSFASLANGVYRLRLMPVSCAGASSQYFEFTIGESTLPSCSTVMNITNVEDLGSGLLRLTLESVLNMSSVLFKVTQSGNLIWQTTLSVVSGNNVFTFPHPLSAGSYLAEASFIGCTGNSDTQAFSIASTPVIPQETDLLFAQTSNGSTMYYAKAPDFDVLFEGGHVTDVTSGLVKTMNGVWRDPLFGNKYVYYFINYTLLTAYGGITRTGMYDNYQGLSLFLEDGTYTIHKVWSDISNPNDFMNNLFNLTIDNSKHAQITVTIRNASN